MLQQFTMTVRLLSAAAAATLLIGFSIVLLLTLEWLRGRSEKMRTSASHE